MVKNTKTNIKDFNFDAFASGYISYRITQCVTVVSDYSLKTVTTIKDEKLLPKFHELKLIESILNIYKYLPKKYAYKTLQFHIVEMRQFLSSLCIDKPQKANLPDHIDFFKIEDYTKILNRRFNCSFDSKLLSLAIDKYLSLKMTQVEDQKKLYNISKSIFSYSNMNKIIAKLQELVLDKHYHNLGYVSSKTLWLTFQYLIEHIIDCGCIYTVKKCDPEIIMGLHDEFVLYDSNAIFSALNDYLTNIDSVVA